MWAHIVATAVGLWLMAAPAVLGYGPPAATSDRIAGPLIATFACVAVWEVTRGARWANVPLGVWLIVAPWVLGFGAAAAVNSTLCGVAAVALACAGGHVSGGFGGGWSSLWRKEELAWPDGKPR